MLGLDLSAGMAAMARTSHAGLPFAAADAAALPLRTGVLGGLVRATRPGAPVLVAFQGGDGQRVDKTTSYSQPVPLTYYRHRVDEVQAALETAGFASYATISRSAALWFESTPQAALLAHREERR